MPCGRQGQTPDWKKLRPRRLSRPGPARRPLEKTPRPLSIHVGSICQGSPPRLYTDRIHRPNLCARGFGEDSGRRRMILAYWRDPRTPQRLARVMILRIPGGRGESCSCLRCGCATTPVAAERLDIAPVPRPYLAQVLADPYLSRECGWWLGWCVRWAVGTVQDHTQVWSGLGDRRRDRVPPAPLRPSCRATCRRPVPGPVKSLARLAQVLVCGSPDYPFRSRFSCTGLQTSSLASEVGK